MKRSNILRYIIPASAMIIALSSCLKDDNVQQDLSNLKPVVEFPDATPNADGAPNSQPVGVIGNTNPVEFTIPINYASDKASPGITVTVAIDAAVLAKYKEVKGNDDLEILPAKYFNIADTKVTIPAGSHTGMLKITFLNTLDPDLLDASYALPLKITDASGNIISGNYGTTVGLFAIKNIYDGSYHATGVFTHPTLGPRDIDQDKDLITVNPTTSETTVGDLSNTMQLKVNADNTVTVIGNISASQPLVPTPGKTSTYDAATKTYHLYYQYSGTGGNRVVQEDLVKN